MTSPTVTAPAHLSAVLAQMDPTAPLEVVTNAILDAATIASHGQLSPSEAQMALEAAWRAIKASHDLLEAADVMPAPHMTAMLALTVLGARAPKHVSTPSLGFRSSQPVGLHTAVVGQPGAGKTQSVGAVVRGMTRLIVHNGVPDCSNAIESPKTGAGLAAAFCTFGKDPTARVKEATATWFRTRDSVLWMVDEFEVFNAHNNASDPLTAIMSTLWSGGRIGDALKDKSQVCVLEEGSYRSSLIVGVQPEKAPGLLSRKGQGFTQRTLFALGETAKPDPPSGLLPLTAHATPSPGISYDYHWPSQPMVHADRLPGWIEAWLGYQYPELDTHRVQLECRVATLLAAMQGRHVIQLEDQWLALALVAMSRIVRDAIVVPAATAAGEAEAAQRGALDAVRQDSRETALSRFSNNRIAKAASAALGGHSCDEGDPVHTFTVTARSISKEQRRMLADHRHNHDLQITMDELRPQRRHVLSMTTPIQITCMPGAC